MKIWNNIIIQYVYSLFDVPKKTIILKKNWPLNIKNRTVIFKNSKSNDQKIQI